jgi:hypothetical protein
VEKYAFFSWMGLLATVILILVLSQINKFYNKHIRKLCKVDRLEQDLEDKLKMFKDTKDIELGKQYNNLRLRVLTINVLLRILSLFIYVMPLFFIYYQVIDLGVFWIWFICFFVLSITVNVLVSRFTGGV